MEKQRSIKIIVVIALFLSVIGISVAFAAMSTNLAINGTGTMNPSTWKVRFQGLSAAIITGGASVTTPPTLSDTNIGTFAVVLTKPGDSITYKFDVKNTGSLDAAIGTFTKDAAPTCVGTAALQTNKDADAALVCGNITYTLKYTADGVPVKKDDVLESGATRNMTLTISYGGTQLPTDAVTISGLDIAMVYIQS